MPRQYGGNPYPYPFKICNQENMKTNDAKPPWLGTPTLFEGPSIYAQKT